MPKPNITQPPEQKPKQQPAQNSTWNAEPYNTPAPILNPYEKYQQLKQNEFQLPAGTQRIWAGYSNINRNITYWKPDNYARYRPDLPPAVWDNTKQIQGYWDNPRNVVEAYNFLRLQDDDYEPPPYVNKDFVNGLYKTLKAYNGTDDTSQWQPLPFGTEEAYIAYLQPGPDWWERQPGNRFTLTAPKPKATVEEQIGKMQLVVDDVNQTLREALEQGQISQDEYEQSVRYFSEYALSEEARATLGEGLTSEQLSQPFDPRDYTKLMVANILDQQGILDIQGKPAKPYSEMPLFAKVLLTIFGAPEEMQVPEASRQTAAVIQGGMTMMGVSAAVGTTAAIAAKASAPIAAALGATGVGAPIAVFVPLITGVIGGFAGYMQYRAAITGEPNPVSKATTTVFNWLAEKTEQFIGQATYVNEIQDYILGMKKSGKSDEEVLQAVTDKYGVDPTNLFEFLSDTFTAGRMYYESGGGSGAGDFLVDSVSTLAHLVNPEWSSGLTTSPGEVWQIQLGLETPQKLGLNSVDTRAAILKDIKSLGPNPKPEDVEGVLAMWYQVLGMSGNMNDFAGQMVIDPLNLVPAGINKSIDVYATKKFNAAVAADDILSAQKYANLSEAAKLAIGNPLIDALPFGVQNVVEVLGRLITKPTEIGTVPKWVRGTLPPAQTFYIANAFDAKGYHPKMFYDVYDNLKKSGQTIPTGSAIDVVPAATPGTAMPLVKMFLSSDRTTAAFSLFDEAGKYVTTQSIKAPEGTTFKSPVEAVDYFKTMVDSDNYKAQFPDDKFKVVLKGAVELLETGKVGLLEYIKSAGEDAPRLVESVSVVKPDDGEVIVNGRINFDSVKEGADTYEVTSQDGRTIYKVDANTDKVISASTDGKSVPIPEEGYLVTAGKNFVLSDSYVNPVDTQLVNSIADAMGVERPYEDLRIIKFGEPSYKAKPTEITGNKIVDTINKLMDLTPEGKIAFTNRAITEVILDVSLLAKQDPDKFFAFFDYIAGKNVEVSQKMRDYAQGSLVATAMLTLKPALAEGSQFDTLRKTWQMGTVHRVQATNLARALGMTPEKMVSMRPDDVFKKLEAYNANVAKTDPSKVIDMSAAELKKFLAPYQGADALPLTKQQLVNKAIFAFVSDSEKAAIKLYNPQPGSNLTQFSNMLKSIIGVPFISANPATWMLNAFNNWVTMNIFIGAGGLFDTNKAMQTSIDRFGVDYTMLVGNEFKVAEVITRATPELQKILHPDNWMTDVRKFISHLSASETVPLGKLADAAGVRPEDLIVMNPADIVKAVEAQNSKIKNPSQRKFPNLTEATVERMVAPYVGENAKPLTKNIFNPLSTYGKIEQYFARRAMKIAIEQIMGAMELSPVNADLRSDMLSTGMTERQIAAFQALANRAYNTDEIRSFYKKGEVGYNPIPEEIIKTTIDKLSGGDDAQKAALNSLLDFNGLRDDIVDLLSKPRTPEELDAARLSVYRKFKEAAIHSRFNNLVAEFAKVTEDTAGHIGLLKNLFEVGQEEYRTLFSVNRQFGEFWDAVDNASRSGLTDDAFRAYKANLWTVTSEITKSMWEDAYKTMLNAVTAGMAKTGLGEDADFFVTNLAERLELMRGVHSKITKINQDAYDGVIKSTDAPKLLDKVYSDYRKARDANQKAWVDKIIELYDKNGVAPNGRTKEEVHNVLVGYMGEFLKKDRKFRNDILEHRRAIEGLDYDNKRTANKNFYEQVYQAQAQEILRFLTNEAYEEFNTIRPSKHASKGERQTRATKPKEMTQAELDVANKRATLERNETALEHRRMLQEQAKAAYGQYNKMSFEGELFAATNLTDAQKVAASAYFDAFDATVKRLSGGKFGFYDRLGEIRAYEGEALPAGEFGYDIAKKHIAALTIGPDNKFILNFATDAADAVSVFHEGSHAIMYTARQLYDMGVFDGYKTIIEDAGKTTIEAFDAMDDAAKSKVMDDIADSMFKWQADPEVAKSMPAKLKSAFQTISAFFTEFISRLMERYKDIEISPALKEVYRSLFTQNDMTAKAERNAARISQFKEGTRFKVFGATPDTSFELIPVVVEADTIRPSHNLGGQKNPDFPQEYQPRTYNVDFVREKARNLTPERLLSKPVDLSNGSPVIDESGNVIAGNHRMGFLIEAKESYPDQWAKYQSKLKESLSQYGLTEADIEGIQNPVLVYKAANSDDVMRIVNEANAPSQQIFSPLEYANRNAKFLSNESIAELQFGENQTVDEVLSSKAAYELRKQFIDNLYDSEKGQYLIKDTRLLNDTGKEAFKNALVAKVYGGTPDGQIMLKAIIEDGSDFSKVLIDAMTEAVPGMAKVNALIETGRLSPSYAIGDKIATAVLEYQIWRNLDPTIRPPLEQAGTDLFRVLPPEVVKMEQFFHNNITNSRRIANFFNLYAQEAIKIGSVDPNQILIPGFELPTELTKTADELLNGLLDKVNAEKVATVSVDTNNEIINQLVNNTINGWEPKIKNNIEPILRQFASDVKKPTVPPDWALVEGLYDGTSKSYTKIRKTITEILNGTAVSDVTYPEMRSLILTQAHNKLISESRSYRVAAGVEGTATADSLMAKNAISKLTSASMIEGTDLEKHNAIATPLKEAIKLLNDMKARNGDAESIAKLEAAIAAAPEKLLSDADINKVTLAPTEITAEIKQQLFDLGYTEEDISAMTPAEAWRIIGEGKPFIPPEQSALFQPEELTYQPAEQPLPPVTPDPPQGPLSIDQARALDQLNDNEIMNLVGEITDNLEKYMREHPTFEMEKNIPAKALDALEKQVAIWEGELDSKKITALDYAKSSRDHALLDYTQRRGIDGAMQHIWPYHFWYTSSVVEWAKHLLGAPEIAAAWSRYEELRRRNGMIGYPTRMAGKMWIPTPWLPDYLGNEIFLDPFSRLMPLESIAQPVSLFSDLSADIYSRTVYQINTMVRDGIITQEQGAAAIQLGSGDIWEDALAEVMLQDDLMTNDVVTLASRMMGIAPWWQYPYYFATGQEDKISPMPPTRLGQALSSFRGQGWAWDMLSYVGEVLKYPEEKVRETLGMSPYGEPGDYYIRLMLTSMLGDGTTSDVDEVEKQMIERKGDLWEEAKRRADVYLSARLPGSLFLHTVAQFTNDPTPENAKAIAPAFMLTLFPAGMIPEGEQYMRNLNTEYQKAWREYNMGNSDALNEFYDKHPEYRARQDMFKSDETMLKGFLVDQIWDKWSSIPAASRQLATQALGESFQRLFLDAKAYTNIDNNTLAAWSYQLGGYVPVTEETEAAASATQLPVPRYSPEVEAAVAEFQAERAERYPDYYWQQQIYWDPASDKEELKRTMPSYFDYLEWRKQYYKDHPLVAQWAEDQSARGRGDESLLAPTSDMVGQTQPAQSLLIEFDDALKAELGKYIVNGTPLSAGAKAELNRVWEAKGRPGSSLEQWINAVLGLQR